MKYNFDDPVALRIALQKGIAVKYLKPLFIFATALTFTTHAIAAPHLVIAPAPNTIIQQDATAHAAIPLKLAPDVGSVTITLTRQGQTHPLATRTLQSDRAVGVLPRVPVGLYELCAIQIGAKPKDRTKDCRTVGIGEVFLVAGQSNAVSCDLSGKRHASNTDWVAVNDVKGELSVKRAEDAEPDVETFVIPGRDKAITTNVAWMRLGDQLVNSRHTPVMFVNVARNATSTDCWKPDGGICWRFFAKVLASRAYRAVLWQQGESDVMNEMKMEASLANMTALIEASRKIAPGIPWFVAHNSLKNGTPYDDQTVRRAQTEVVAKGLACAGPDTDVIRDHPDWVGAADFGGDGLTYHGDLWFPVINAFLASGSCRHTYDMN